MSNSILEMGIINRRERAHLNEAMDKAFRIAESSNLIWSL